jgi:DNA-binding CsgD family transcriptional regulator
MLATHLSFPETAQELFLSRHTVKSQAKSLYRKLGATSRNEAVARARGAGAPGEVISTRSAADLLREQAAGST